MAYAKSSSSVPTEFLYIGAAGEHYIMSECFRHNMEAFKLPIDKGFDLVVTRAYRHLSRLDDVRKPVDPGLPDTPIYVQVKSRQATPSRRREKRASGRCGKAISRSSRPTWT